MAKGLRPLRPGTAAYASAARQMINNIRTGQLEISRVVARRKPKRPQHILRSGYNLYKRLPEDLQREVLSYVPNRESTMRRRHYSSGPYFQITDYVTEGPRGRKRMKLKAAKRLARRGGMKRKRVTVPLSEYTYAPGAVVPAPEVVSAPSSVLVPVARPFSGGAEAAARLRGVRRRREEMEFIDPVAMDDEVFSDYDDI